MSGDVIALGIIVWIVGIIGLSMALMDENIDFSDWPMIAFWPITLAVYLIIGPVYTVYAVTRRCLRMFKNRA